MLLLIGAGAVLLFIGVALFSAHLVVPMARRSAGRATRIGGAAGSLARENSQRNPQRTASTAAALMIGLALVTLVATLAAGIIGTFNSAVDDLARGEFYAITAQNDFSPIPISASQAAAKAPGRGDGRKRAGGRDLRLRQHALLTGVDPTIGKVINLDWTQGDQSVLSSLGADGAFIDDGFAENHDLTLGRMVVLLTPTGETMPVAVRGIFEPPAGGSPFGPVTISSATFDSYYENPKNVYSVRHDEGRRHGRRTPPRSSEL